MSREMISRADVAEMLRVKPYTLRQWAAAGLGPKRAQPGTRGKSALYYRDEIEALVQAVERGEASLPTAKEANPYYRQAVKAEARVEELEAQLAKTLSDAQKHSLSADRHSKALQDKIKALESQPSLTEATTALFDRFKQSADTKRIKSLTTDNQKLNASILSLKNQNANLKLQLQQAQSLPQQPSPRSYGPNIEQLQAQIQRLKRDKQLLRQELDRALAQPTTPLPSVSRQHIPQPPQQHFQKPTETDPHGIAGLQWANDIKNSRKPQLISEYIRIFGKRPRSNIGVETLRKKVINASPTHQLLRGKIVSK